LSKGERCAKEKEREERREEVKVEGKERQGRR
jgi:hypothetical protein